jgi:ABC-type branched-subunit amino acid transport system ATPase component
MPGLVTKELLKHFDGVKAVNRLSVQFKPGAITGLVGPNGSGKSTLINLLSGLIPIDGGAVLIGEHTKLEKIDSSQVSSLGLTRTFQDVRLFEQMSVLDNILIVLTERNLISAFFEKHTAYHLDQAETLLRQVGLWEKRGEEAGSLSYGQRKLLEVARALGTKAEIYLFDEPFAGMFPEMRKIVAEVLKSLRASGKTVVLIEHNMDLIRELCDFVYVIDSGELLAEGVPDKVLNDKEVIEAYLGE